jgi:hypothetical protein
MILRKIIGYYLNDGVVKMGRTNKAAKNGIAGMISYCIQAIASLYTQYLFIKILGYNVLGLNTILYTIINSLAITEMGIGTAIIFSLYEPLAKKDERKVAALVRLYKKFYTGGDGYGPRIVYYSRRY